MQSKIRMKYECADRFRSIQSNPVKAKTLQKKSVLTGANIQRRQGTLKNFFFKKKPNIYFFIQERLISHQNIYFFIWLCKKGFLFLFLSFHCRHECININRIN